MHEALKIFFKAARCLILAYMRQTNMKSNITGKKRKQVGEKLGLN